MRLVAHETPLLLCRCSRILPLMQAVGWCPSNGGSSVRSVNVGDKRRSFEVTGV
jgi:hypothetical protein